jgi:hypothetical protein
LFAVTPVVEALPSTVCPVTVRADDDALLSTVSPVTERLVDVALPRVV